MKLFMEKGRCSYLALRALGFEDGAQGSGVRDQPGAPRLLVVQFLVLFPGGFRIESLGFRFYELGFRLGLDLGLAV